MVLFLSGIIPITLAVATPGTPLVVTLKKESINRDSGEIQFTIHFSYDKGNHSQQSPGAIEVYTKYFFDGEHFTNSEMQSVPYDGNVFSGNVNASLKVSSGTIADRYDIPIEYEIKNTGNGVGNDIIVGSSRSEKLIIDENETGSDGDTGNESEEGTDPGSDEGTGDEPEEGSDPGSDEGTGGEPEEGTAPGSDEGTGDKPEEGSDPGSDEGTGDEPEEGTSPSSDEGTGRQSESDLDVAVKAMKKSHGGHKLPIPRRGNIICSY